MLEGSGCSGEASLYGFLRQSLCQLCQREYKEGGFANLGLHSINDDHNRAYHSIGKFLRQRQDHLLPLLDIIGGILKRSIRANDIREGIPHVLIPISKISCNCCEDSLVPLLAISLRLKQ